MNTNSKQDHSNLNNNLNYHGGVVNAPGPADAGSSDKPKGEAARSSVSGAPSSSMSNIDYLKTLADAMTSQHAIKSEPSTSSAQHDNSAGFTPSGGGGNSQGQGASGISSSNNFINMQNNTHNTGSDTDTCASSYAARRISRDSLVSRESLSDLLDPVASNNLAMMNMIANQQQQQMGGNQSWNFNSNNGNQQQAISQSMSQLMMNNSMNMNSMGQPLSAGSMMNGAGDNGNSLNMSDAFRNAYGMMNNGNNNNSVAPLLIPPKQKKNKHKQTFAQKLMHILSIKECQNSIRWMPNGCAFCIVDSKALVDQVLPRYFKEAKYTSFTRKLNRWGFKHFTLPTSEPSHEKEMSIYTHEKFLRDNPALCQQMDGGHRRRNSSKDSTPASSVNLLGLGQGLGGGMGLTQQDSQQLQQQQSLMMQQMQQLEQQNMMMQAMQQQVQQQQHQQNNQMNNQNNQGQNSLFDASNIGGGSSNFNSMMFNNNSNNPSSMMGSNMSLMDGNGGAVMGMRRTSLGFMPYLPTSNRRDSGFSIGGLSTASNDLSSSFAMGTSSANEAATNLAALNSTSSIHKIRKAAPDLGSDVGSLSNATFDNFKQGSQGLNIPGVGGDSKDAGATHEGLNHSQAKLAVLEDMIAKERRKQSLLSSLDVDPSKMV